MGKHKRLNFVSWLRVFGVLLILLCHFTQESSSALLNMSAQFFNVGTHVFLLLSGFLFGIQGKPSGSPVQWYKKRLKRIYFPYEIMVCVLLVIHLLTHQNIEVTQWVLQFLGFQGWDGVLGAGHTWFVTSILICYLLTPLIAFAIDRGRESEKLAVTAVISLILPIVLTIPIFSDVSLLLMPLSSYILGYVLGRHFDKTKLGKKSAVLSAGIMIVAVIVRLAGRQLFDGTVLYISIIVTYTQIVIALSIFLIFAMVFKNRIPTRTISFLDSISFEIYLWHYMFTVGPIRLFGIMGNWALDCVVVSAITVFIAFVARKLCSIVSK